MALGDLVPKRRNRRELDVKREYESPLELFRDRMDHLFEDFFEGFALAPWGRAGLAAGSFTPRVNVSENDKEIVVSTELPGMDEKDVELTLTKDSLTIKGEKREEHEEKGRDYHRMERSYGSFQRVIPLTCEVEDSKAAAEFKKGVLTVTLPKTAAARTSAKRIEVKGG